MDNTVEVRYAGVVVGRGAFKELGGDAGGFVSIPEPLPVGTLVTLKMADGVREARVDDVVESAEPTTVGMRIRWGGAALAARPAYAAASAQTAPAPAPSAPAPVVASPDSGPATPGASLGDSGPTVALESPDEGSGAISAPLSLAGPSGDSAQGGGKRRRKRR